MGSGMDKDNPWLIKLFSSIAIKDCPQRLQIDIDTTSPPHKHSIFFTVNFSINNIKPKLCFYLLRKFNVR